MSRGRLWVGPAVFVLLDAALTLAGQPSAYWEGDRLAARELNPAAGWLLRWHPAAFAAGAAAWLGVGFVALRLSPPATARVLAFTALFAHALGAGTWLVTAGPVGYLGAGLTFLAGARLLGWSWQEDGPPGGPAEPAG